MHTRSLPLTSVVCLFACMSWVDVCISYGDYCECGEAGDEFYYIKRIRHTITDGKSSGTNTKQNAPVNDKQYRMLEKAFEELGWQPKLTTKEAKALEDGEIPDKLQIKFNEAFTACDNAFADIYYLLLTL